MRNFILLDRLLRLNLKAATSFREFNSLFEKKKKNFFQINPMAKGDVF